MQVTLAHSRGHLSLRKLQGPLPGVEKKMGSGKEITGIPEAVSLQQYVGHVLPMNSKEEE